jgi:hypothetical protein
MTTILEPRCSVRRCKHFLWTKPYPGDEMKPFPRFINICEAFPYPKGIPDEINSGKNDHTTPYPGDNGIRYERKPKGKKG